MKWNGTVSQSEKTTIATRLASENAAHATSTAANGQRKPGRIFGQCRPGGRCGQCRPGGRCGQCTLAGRCGQCRPAGRPASWRSRRGAGPSGGEPITLTTHRLDQVEPELGSQ